ncbi:hypothetical protein [Caenispirillum salinarum]|uniref:hypothetical protein n=1 Tax=Caenispirillum salinarum TaxID=859058 RepID=UPI00384FEF8F
MLFKIWVGLAIIGGLFIMIGGPIAERHVGHDIIAMADIATVLFLTITGLGWLVYMVMTKRRTGTNTGERDGDTRTPTR